MVKEQFLSSKTVNVFVSENFKLAPFYSDCLFYTAVFAKHIFNTSFITMAIVGLSEPQVASLFCVITQSSKFTKYLTNS